MSKQRPRYPNRNRDTVAPRSEVAEAIARAVVIAGSSHTKFAQTAATLTGTVENRALVDGFFSNPDGF
jgi:hypothetical protein